MPNKRARQMNFSNSSTLRVMLQTYLRMAFSIVTIHFTQLTCQCLGQFGKLHIYSTIWTQNLNVSAMYPRNVTKY